MRRIRSANRKLEEVIESQIDPSASGSNLLQAASAHESDVLPVKVVKNSILAAWTSLGAAAAWLLVDLYQNPKAADQLLVDRDNSAAKAFVLESLRMHPPLWLLHRSVVRSAQLDRISVSAPDSVAVSVYHIHRDGRWWDSDPSLFDPSRWMGGTRPHAQFGYLPFSIGPRRCFAEHLATTVMVDFVAQVAQNYRVQLLTRGPVAEDASAFLVPKDVLALLAPLGL